MPEDFDAARARELLDLLPPNQRELLILRVTVSLSVEDTARALGMTQDEVRVAQLWALAWLRAWDEEDDESPEHGRPPRPPDEDGGGGGVREPRRPRDPRGGLAAEALPDAATGSARS